MSGGSNCTIYVGNLDERVTDWYLYDILIQAGRLVDLHIPRDKETDKPKGYAFAEYETEEIAEYAVELFSGLVTLYNRSLKFAPASSVCEKYLGKTNSHQVLTPCSFPNQTYITYLDLTLYQVTKRNRLCTALSYQHQAGLQLIQGTIWKVLKDFVTRNSDCLFKRSSPVDGFYKFMRTQMYARFHK